MVIVHISSATTVPDVTLEQLSRLPFGAMDKAAEGTQTVGWPLHLPSSSACCESGPRATVPLFSRQIRTCLYGAHFLVGEADCSHIDKDIAERTFQSAEETKTGHQDKE